ncbi:MAG: AAA family ATPase, partial [Beijerinckiaceae bacterium]|nr:AAA family ATPase [Beijerinckiaceae bacterium]
ELTISHADILRIEAQTFQTRLAPAQILERTQARQAKLIGLPHLSHQLQRFMPAEAVRDEHALLKTALNARGAWIAPEPAAIEAVLAGSTASNEQRDAVRHMLGPDGVCVAEGAAGAGKTHVLRLLRDILVADQRQVLVAAPAWRAARLAGQEARVALSDAQALDPLAAEIREGKRVLDRNTVIIVDEAGMAGSRDLQTLVEATTAADAKLILTGDTRQLQPVARGAPMRALIDLLGSNRLDQIRRQGLEWMREASTQFAAGNAAAGLARYDEAGVVAVHRDRETTLAACVRSYLDDPSRAEPDWSTQALAQRLLIAVRNEDVAELNRRVRQILIQDGQLGETAIVVDAVGRGGGSPVPVELRVGDRVMFGRRLRLAPQVFNSDVATILSVDNDGEEPRIVFRLDRHDDNGRPLELAARISDLAVRDQAGVSAAVHLQHAYAVTNYAAQGATVEVAVVAHLCAMNASNLYVACTRHRLALRIEVDGERVLKLNRSRRAGISRDGGFRGVDQETQTPERALTPDQVSRVMKQLQREANAQPLKANPSDYVDDVRDWLGAADPVSAFRLRMRARSDAQIVPKIDSGRASEMTAASAPLPVQVPAPGHDHATSDPEALSVAERQRLAAMLSPAICVSWFGGRLTRAGILAHPASGYALDPRVGTVGWSRRADQRLRTAGAESESRLVQAAVVLLGRSLRQARSFVRDRAALWVLNPIARALRAHRAAAWRERLSMPPSSVVAPLMADDQFEPAPSAGLRRFKAMIARTRRVAQECAAEVDRGIKVSVARTAGFERPDGSSAPTGLDRRDGMMPDQERALSRHIGWASPGGDPSTRAIVQTTAHPAGSPSLPALTGSPSFTLDDEEAGSTGSRRRRVELRRIGGKGQADHRQAESNVTGPFNVSASAPSMPPLTTGRSLHARAFGSVDPTLVSPRIFSKADILWPSARPPVVNPAGTATAGVGADAKPQTLLPAGETPGSAAIIDAPGPIRNNQSLGGLSWQLPDDDEHQPTGKRLRKIALKGQLAARRSLDQAPSQISANQAESVERTVQTPTPGLSASTGPLEPETSVVVHSPSGRRDPHPPATNRTSTNPYRKLDPTMINPRTLMPNEILPTPFKPPPQKAERPMATRKGRPQTPPGDKEPGM